MAYEKITKYIDKLGRKDTAEAFCQAFYKFLDAHPGIRVSDYQAFLKERGILKQDGGFAEPDDYSQTDGITAVTMILGIIRGDRFCEGLLDKYIENGTVARCLARLKAIDGKDGR